MEEAKVRNNKLFTVIGKRSVALTAVVQSFQQEGVQHDIYKVLFHFSVRGSKADNVKLGAEILINCLTSVAGGAGLNPTGLAQANPSAGAGYKPDVAAINKRGRDRAYNELKKHDAYLAAKSSTDNIMDFFAHIVSADNMQGYMHISPGPGVDGFWQTQIKFAAEQPDIRPDDIPTWPILPRYKVLLQKGKNKSVKDFYWPDFARLEPLSVANSNN